MRLRDEKIAKKPDFRQTTAGKSQLAVHARAVAKAKPLAEAKLANSIEPKSFLGAPTDIPKRPARFWGTGRPAPGKSVVSPESAIAFLSRQKALAAIQDAIDLGSHTPTLTERGKLVRKSLPVTDHPTVYGFHPEADGRYQRHVSAAAPVRPFVGTKAAKFDTKLQKDRGFQQIVNDPVDGINNVAMASAFGLPVGGEAAKKYIETAADVLKSGAMGAADVPGLVLSKDNADLIAQLQGKVIARGFSKDEVDNMNFGELIAHAMGNSKYNNWWKGPGGRFIATSLTNLPRSIGQGIVGFPAGAAMLGAAAGHDTKEFFKHISDPGAATYQSDDVTKELASQIKDFAVAIKDRPYETFTQDPFNTALAAWSAVHGGAGLAGRFARGGPRLVRVARGQNEGTFARTVESPMPNGPIIPPGDRPIPADPVFGPGPRGIDPGPSGRTAGAPTASPVDPLTALRDAAEARADESYQRTLAHARQLDADRQLQRGLPVRGQLENPALKKAELDHLTEQRDRLVAERARVKKIHENSGDYGKAKSEVTRLQSEASRVARESLSSNDPREIQRLRLEANVLDRSLSEARRHAAQIKATRKMLVPHLADLRHDIRVLDDKILHRHIDLNIEHPKATKHIANLERQLRNAIRMQRSPGEIQGIRERLDAVKNLGKEDELADFKNATKDLGPDWFEGSEEPLTPMQHAADIFSSKWRSEHGGESPDSDAAAQDLMAALDELSMPNDSSELPGLHPVADPIDAAYHRIFGDEGSVADTEITPDTARKIQTFLQEAQKEVIDYQKYWATEQAHSEGVAEGSVDNTLRDRIMEQSINEQNANMMADAEGGSGTVEDFLHPGPAPNVTEGNVTTIDFPGHSSMFDPNAQMHPLDAFIRPEDFVDTPRALTDAMKVADGEVEDIQAFLSQAMRMPRTIQLTKSIESAQEELVHLQDGIDRIDKVLKSREGEVVSPAFPRPGTELERTVTPEEPVVHHGEIVEPGDRLPAARRDVSDNPPNVGAHANVDSGERGLPSGPGTDLVLVPKITTPTKVHGKQDLVVNRGQYSHNLIDRVFQWIDDSMLESERDIFGKRQAQFLKKQTQIPHNHARRTFYMHREEIGRDLVKAATKVSDAERTAIVQAHSQGPTPMDMRDMYKILLNHEAKKLRKQSIPKEIIADLKTKIPAPETIDNLIDFLKDKPGYEDHIRWLQEYKIKTKNMDFHDDPLYGNLVTSLWENSVDLKKSHQLWSDIYDKVGNYINEPMQNLLDEMRKASGKIDDMLDEGGILPRKVMDERRYQRQRMVSSILGREIPLDPHAVYVPDRANTTRKGDYLMRRARSYDPDRVFNPRLRKNTGALLTEGKLNPAFSSYYTGITSAMAKLDAIRLQREVLDKFAHKVDPTQLTYDGDKFVMFDGSKGKAERQIETRAIIRELNGSINGYRDTHMGHLSNEQRIRYRDERFPNRGITAEERITAKNGDLYLIPRDVYDEMTKPATGAQFNPLIGRLLQAYTVMFRKVALALRPAYLVVNTAESGFRTVYFGNVSPLMAYRTARLGILDREKMIPEHVKRTTFAGNIKRPPMNLGTKGEKLQDLWLRARRAPFFGNAVDTAKYIAGGYGDTILSASARAENYMRESLIISELMKSARREKFGPADPRRYVKGMDETMQLLMERVAKGEDPSLGGEMDDIIKKVTRILGDFSGSENKWAQTTFPFYRWMSFITKFVLWESPVHYPGRTLLLNQVGQMGWDELQKMGLLPANIQGAVPVSGTKTVVDPTTGEEHKVINIMYSQAWNGLSTVVNLFGVNAATGQIQPLQGFAKNLNPFYQAAFTAGTLHDINGLRPLQDRNKQPFTLGLDSNFNIFVAQMMKTMWPAVLGYDYTEMADNSVPIFREIFKDRGLAAQPQSNLAEKLTALGFGTRRRPYDLTKLQQKNMGDAFSAMSSVYKALGDPEARKRGEETPAQIRFREKFEKEYFNQLHYINEWMKVYGVDPSTVD